MTAPHIAAHDEHAQSSPPSGANLEAAVLTLARAHGPLVADTPEDGHALAEQLTGQPLPPPAFHDAVRRLASAGLLRDPVLLEPQALHCRWRLEAAEPA